MSQPSSTTAVLAASRYQYLTGAPLHASKTYIHHVLSMMAIQANLADVTAMTQTLIQSGQLLRLQSKQQSIQYTLDIPDLQSVGFLPLLLLLAFACTEQALTSVQT